MHSGKLLLPWIALAICAACAPASQPAAAVAQAAEAAPIAVPTSQPSTYVADAGLAIAVARETADRAARAARKQTLLIHKLLREQALEQKRARDSVERGDHNERCMAGQKMRRVTNGWEQAGTC